MLAAILFLLFVVITLMGILFAPIQIYVNTETSEYYVRVKGLVSAHIEWSTTEILRIRIKTFFMERSFYPIKKYSGQKEKTRKHKPRKKRRVNFTKVLRVLKSFQVKRFLLDIDTGDYLINAKLFPVFVLLDQFLAPFHINYQNRNILIMDLRNRPYRILKQIINK